MKLSERLVCTLLAATLILSLFTIYSSATDVTTEYIDDLTDEPYTPETEDETVSEAENETASQVDVIIAYARTKLGSRAYNGYCQRFVRLCYQAAGIYATVGVYSALEASENWIVSTSRENIPVGAVLYFDMSIYGHVGIYLGNNRMIHALRRVVETDISTSYWDTYLGWGWQGGIKPTGTYISQEDILTGDVYRTNDAIKLFDAPSGNEVLRIAGDTALSVESVVRQDGELWGKTKYYSTTGYVRLKYCTYAYTVGGGMTVKSLDNKKAVSAEILTMPYKYYYVSGEEIDTAGLELSVTYSDGTTAVTRSGFSLCTTVATGAGRDVVLLNCAGQLLDYSIIVSETGSDISKFSSRSSSAVIDSDLGAVVLYKDVKVSRISSILRSSSKMTVYSADGEVKTGGYFATGDYIVYSTGSDAVAITVIRYGDINGDGEVNSADSLCLGRYRLGTYRLDSRIAKLVTEPVTFVEFDDPCFETEETVVSKNMVFPEKEYDLSNKNCVK